MNGEGSDTFKETFDNLERAEITARDNEFRNFMRYGYRATAGSAFLYGAIASLSSLYITSGVTTGHPISLVGGILIASALPLYDYMARRVPLRRAREYIERARANQDYRFYSGLMEADIPVTSIYVQEAADFAESLRGEERRFFRTDWEAANVELVRLYEEFLETRQEAPA